MLFAAFVPGYQLPALAPAHAPVRAAVAAMAVAEPTAAASGPLANIDREPSTRVEGNTLKTWNIAQECERVQVSLKNSGRPIESRVELWNGPDYNPFKFSVYTMDGQKRPVDAIIETPKTTNSVAVYNTQDMDMAFEARVADTGLGKAMYALADEVPELIQGAGAVRSYTFGPEVDSVQVLLNTVDQGQRNMKVTIELTEGPNSVRQKVNVYCSSGYKNPFYAVIQTPAPESTLRIINKNTVEFPVDAIVLPYEVNEVDSAPIMGGFGR